MSGGNIPGGNIPGWNVPGGIFRGGICIEPYFLCIITHHVKWFVETFFMETKWTYAYVMRMFFMGMHDIS